MYVFLRKKRNDIFIKIFFLIGVLVDLLLGKKR